MTDQYYQQDEIEAPYQALEGFSMAPIAGEQSQAEPIKAEDLFGCLTKKFWIKTPPGANLESLSKSASDGFKWEIPDELKQYLRHVTKDQNRHLPGKEDLDGDLAKGLFLKARVVAMTSDCPKDLNVDIEGLVPNVVTSNGRTNWVIPANCGYSKVDENIFDPSNYFYKYMYEHNQKCDLKTLAQHIRLDYDPHKQICVMPSDGVGWKVLMDNISRGNFAEYAESIAAKNAAVFQSEHAQLAQVPYAVGQEIYNAIAAPLKQIEKSYTGLDTWDVRIRTTDGLPWNSLQGLIKDSVGFGGDSIEAEQTAKVVTPFSAGILLELTYVLNN